MNWRFWSRQDSSQPDTCASIEPLLSLFSDGMASPSEARRVESHLDECPECRRALEWMEATRLVIAKRPVAIPPSDLRMRIAQAIAAEAAANTTFHPKSRSFVTRPAFAMVASIALVGALLLRLDYTPNPQPITVAPTNVPPFKPVRTANNIPASPAVKPTSHPASSLHTGRIAPPSANHPVLLRPVTVHPMAKTLTAAIPDASTQHAPQVAVLPPVNSRPVPPHVKPSPSKLQVVVNPPKSGHSPVKPTAVTNKQTRTATLPTELPLHNNSDTMITPTGPSVDPDTTQVIRPEAPPVENVAVHTPSTDVLSVVHQHVLASLAAFKTDTKVVRDPSAHVQTASYHSGGLSSDPGRPFVQMPTNYTPTDETSSK